MSPTKTVKLRACQICGQDKPSLLHPGILVRHAVGEMIQKEVGKWSEEGWICSDDLQKYHHQYAQSLLEKEKGELSDLDKEVLESLKQQEVLSHNPDDDSDSDSTFGQRLADGLAKVGGSWGFISFFGVSLFGWIGLNVLVMTSHAFDPYPFILLNLVLSCLAAIQAPVIMMSQHRQESRDRKHAIQDYQVNLKAELEIRHLHQKFDHLLAHQWEKMVAIQEVQLELMAEIRDRK